jgi:TRAP-type C4-dicarboxylate transport system permease small subunit
MMPLLSLLYGRTKEIGSMTLSRLKGIIDRVVNVLIVFLFLIIFASVLLQIFLRYLLNFPLTWSEELSRYLFIMVCFLGWTLATRNKSHIKVNIILDALPAKIRFLVKVFIQMLVLVFAVALIYLGSRMTYRSIDVPSITLFFGFAYIYAFVPISGAIIFFYAILETIDLVRSRG